MNEEQAILELLLDDPMKEPDDFGVSRIRTFEQAGIMTRNAGLIVTMSDGTEYQITIVQCR